MVTNRPETRAATALRGYLAGNRAINKYYQIFNSALPISMPLAEIRGFCHGLLVVEMLIEEPGPVGEYFFGFRCIGIQDEVDVRHAFKDVQLSLYIGSA